MKKNSLLTGALMLALASTAQGQSANCPAPSNSPGTPAGQAMNAASDVCRMAADIFQLMAPQLGLALTGGNATLGRGGTLGGFPRFTIGIRGNVFNGDLPDIENFPAPRTATNPGPRELPINSQIVGLPAVDLAVGIFRGLPLGFTNVGGVDLLLSATYVPEIGSAGDDFVISPESGLRLGYGARLGLIQESLLLPGVGVTVLRRDLPVTTITATGEGFEFTLRDLSVRTTAWRAVASKNILLFGLAAGVGQDFYRQSVTMSGSANPAPDASAGFDGVRLVQDLTRTNMFVDLAINLPVLKIVGEVGRVAGGNTEPLFNYFEGVEVTRSRTYGSVGIRIGF